MSSRLHKLKGPGQSPVRQVRPVTLFTSGSGGLLRHLSLSKVISQRVGGGHDQASQAPMFSINYSRTSSPRLGVAIDALQSPGLSRGPMALEITCGGLRPDKDAAGSRALDGSQKAKHSTTQ